MAVAMIAVFFALGGTAIAAHHYLITSASQIKPSVLVELRGKAGSPGLQGPEGAQGATGLQGPTGPPGAAGKEGKEGKEGREGQEGRQGPPGPVNTSSLTEVLGEEALLPSRKEKGPNSEVEGLEGSFAICPNGSHVVSGGSNIFAGRSGAIAGELSVASEDRSAWIVIAANGGEEKGIVEAIGFCAVNGRAVIAGKGSTAARRARDRAEMRRLFAKLAKRWMAKAARR